MTRVGSQRHQKKKKTLYVILGVVPVIKKFCGIVESYGPSVVFLIEYHYILSSL